MTIGLRVHHTGLTVTDLQRSVDFYSRFGFVEEVRLESSGPDAARGTAVPDARMSVAMMVRDGVRLELLAYARTVDGPLPNNGVGAAHIAIEVADIDSAVAELTGDGVRFLSDVIDHPSGIRWVYLEDPDGITTELFEAP
jgi:catechol 2,3-dioxygenase-like lactoylglutathione lyase family enzyme